MAVNALMMEPTDNVVTCIRDITAGETVSYLDKGEIHTLVAVEDIPYCHKVALVDIEQGGEVIKYGEVIGSACRPLAKGCWVSHHNIESIPRDYSGELQ